MRGHNPAARCGLTAVCPVLQVRCAAVFALGTFVGNSAERTDHSTTIDHNVAMMLAQLINDGSPVVRKVRGPQVAGGSRAPRGRSPVAPGGLTGDPDRGREPSSPTDAPLTGQSFDVCLILYQTRFFTRYSCVCFI